MYYPNRDDNSFTDNDILHLFYWFNNRKIYKYKSEDKLSHVDKVLQYYIYMTSLKLN